MKRDKVKFSIITPAKQIDDFTKMAIDSVQSQTIRSLFEHIIIIDDQNSNLPENHKYDDIIVNPQVEELAIEGSCVALLRESI